MYGFQFALIGGVDPNFEERSDQHTWEARKDGAVESTIAANRRQRNSVHRRLSSARAVQCVPRMISSPSETPLRPLRPLRPLTRHTLVSIILPLHVPKVPSQKSFVPSPRD